MYASSLETNLAHAHEKLLHTSASTINCRFRLCTESRSKAYAEGEKGYQRKREACKTDDPLSEGVFDKMVVQDITYAIIGEATPVSGIKVDVSKPEAMISGAFTPKWIDVISFDFKVGSVDKNATIFKGFGNLVVAQVGVRVAL
jgi:hypothetical protein